MSTMINFDYTKVKAAFDDYLTNLDDMNAASNALLSSLNIPQDQLNEFEQLLLQKYKGQYFIEDDFGQYVRETLNPTSTKPHILCLDGLCGMYAWLEHYASSQATLINKVGIFSVAQDDSELLQNIQEPNKRFTRSQALKK